MGWVLGLGAHGHCQLRNPLSKGQSLRLDAVRGHVECPPPSIPETPARPAAGKGWHRERTQGFLKVRRRP